MPRYFHLANGGPLSTCRAIEAAQTALLILMMISPLDILKLLFFIYIWNLSCNILIPSVLHRSMSWKQQELYELLAFFEIKQYPASRHDSNGWHNSVTHIFFLSCFAHNNRNHSHEVYCCRSNTIRHCLLTGRWDSTLITLIKIRKVPRTFIPAFTPHAISALPFNCSLAF